jgi:hypothetical protein
MASNYGRPTISFGFSRGIPRDVMAMLVVVFVTYSLQFFAPTAWLVELLRLTPLVWMKGFVWQLVTFPFAGAGQASIFILLELLFLFFFARDVYARLGRRGYWRVLLVGCVSGGVVALLADLAARAMGQVPEQSLYLVQGQHMLFIVVIAAFAVLYRDATIMLMLIIPVQARWFLPIELLVTFILFLRTHDLPGFLGVFTAIAVTWATLSMGGLSGAGRESWLRAQGWWMKRRLGRLRRKRGFRVVDDGRKDPWLH